MRLGIDGRRLAQRRTGVGRYLERLIWHWQRMDLPFDEVVCYVPAPLNEGVPGRSPRVRFQVLGPRLGGVLWENGPLRRAAASCDLFFGASYSLPVWCPVPGVVSNLGIYDSQPGTFPWWHRWRYTSIYRHSARRAETVIANSRSTRDDIVRYYGVRPEKIRVVYPGIDGLFAPIPPGPGLEDGVRRITGREGPFFLMVGKLSVRRHIPELLQSLALLRRSGRPERLVIVGPNHLGMPVQRYIREAGVEDDVTYIPHLPQEELRFLYSAATAFVLPTTHEGFSFTILEALACGAPVITVDHPALREGILDSVRVVAAPTVEALAEAMREVAESPRLARELSQKGLACSRKFSWERTAKKTMGILWATARAASDERVARGRRHG